MAAKVAEEQAAEMHRQRALTTKQNRSVGIRARPQRPPLHGRIDCMDPAVKSAMRHSDSSGWAPQPLRLVAQSELVDIIVVRGPAQLGGRNQVAASWRGSQVCCTDYILSSSGIVVKWHSALALHRVVCFSDQVRATHTCMVDLVCASHGALGAASKWKVYVGDALWRGFSDFSGERGCFRNAAARSDSSCKPRSMGYLGTTGQLMSPRCKTSLII